MVIFMSEYILIVEDDLSVAEGLRDILTGCGYDVSAAAGRREAMALLQSRPVDLILLDVTLGQDNGFELCREIRKSSFTPILFLTACNSEMELVRGFRMGGDDYVTKPFRMQELLVRIEALLRRASGRKRKRVTSGGLSFDKDKLTVSRDGRVLDLTSTERKLAFALLERWPASVSREALLYEVWDKDADFVEENTLSVNISRLREKLGEFESRPYIETLRGVGYRWAQDVSR